MKYLVLGSSGQIGNPLCSFLRNRGHQVTEFDFKNGHDYDLRHSHGLAHSTLNLDLTEADFVFFLAFDIGGSKYLSSQQHNIDFIKNNSMIMSHVFQVLEEQKKPFVFASSTMAEQALNSPYGCLKRLGEFYTESLGGIYTRFWNVYGPQEHGDKSHVITDLIHKAKHDKEIKLITHGSEKRQFLYVDDACSALEKLSFHYNELVASKKHRIDVTTNVWTEIYDVATVIARHYDVPLHRGLKKDDVHGDVYFQAKRFPDEIVYWHAKTGVLEGIRKLLKHYDAVK